MNCVNVLLENTSYKYDLKILFPVKAVKGQSEITRLGNKMADDFYSKAVSRVRRPIESLFKLIIEETDFQRASKERSTNGLHVHIFDRIAAAFMFLVFNF